MDVLKQFSLAPIVLILLTGCQVGYIVKSGYEQAKILSSRVDNEDILKDPQAPEAQKRKLRLVEEAKIFAETNLGLIRTKNYSSYVQLDRPYVSYVVSAAPKFRLEHHLWTFPIVGSLPYKGFFSEQEAKEEAKKMEEQGFDTYVRGVSAYSTLGYFRDPILSSMLHYEDSDLVNLIIHETVHATLYIKSSADFNERMAVFLGNRGTEAFYTKKEGPLSETLRKIKLENEDEALFSNFITSESEKLKKWYESEPSLTEESKAARLKDMQERFARHLAPLLKSKNYSNFATLKLNNAYLLGLTTYVADLEDFERAFQKNNSDFKKTIEFFKQLQSAEKPEEKLKSLVAPN